MNKKQIEFVGWFGTFLVLLAYIFLLFSFKLFLYVNIIGTTLLIFYSLFKRAYPLVFINAFIALMLIVKSFRI
jgi:hypothetical protein